LQDKDRVWVLVPAGAGEADEVVEESEEGGFHARSGYMVRHAVAAMRGSFAALQDDGEKQATARATAVLYSKERRAMSEEEEQATARATAALYS
jgi:hypothetical protein